MKEAGIFLSPVNGIGILGSGEHRKNFREKSARFCRFHSRFLDFYVIAIAKEPIDFHLFVSGQIYSWNIFVYKTRNDDLHCYIEISRLMSRSNCNLRRAAWLSCLFVSAVLRYGSLTRCLQTSAPVHDFISFYMKRVY